MALTEENTLALKKFESLVLEYYKEPVDGEFEDATAAILDSLGDEVFEIDSDDDGEVAS